MAKADPLLKITQGVKGILGAEDQRCIMNGVFTSGPGPKLEIGCLGGLSTCCIALAAGVEDEIYSIDPFKIEYLSDMAKGIISSIDGPEALDLKSFFPSWVKQVRNICPEHKLIPVIGDRLEVLNRVKRRLEGKELSFLFIDGLHGYEDVKKDIEAYVPLVRKNGIILFHDYGWDTVAKAVDEAIAAGMMYMIGSGYTRTCGKL